jgi:hypothetical protein
MHYNASEVGDPLFDLRGLEPKLETNGPGPPNDQSRGLLWLSGIVRRFWRRR